MAALAKLYTPDGLTPRYPVAFLTNGGGVTERVKAHQLSEWLGVAVGEEQVVLSHTPMRQLTSQYAQQPVLVAGRGQVREVAFHYGFKQVVTPKQLVRAMPAAVPFHEDQGLFPGSADLPCYTRELKYGSPQHPIRAIMVFTDPSDWYRELQLMIDVLTSRGAPGHAPPPGTPPVEVYFSNPDLLWANEFPTPRFGQGAFSACLEALHEKVTGEPLRARHYGKPHAAPYLLAEQLLLRQAQALGLEAAPAEAAHAGAPQQGPHQARTPLPFSGIYAVGDNPAADVRGANAAGAPWVSCLVTKTGVARANCSADPAQGPGNERAMIDFVAPVYQNDGAGTRNLFGPTLRLRGGDTAVINLLNNLTKPAGEDKAALPLNGFTHVSDTNLHGHGIHAETGVASQAQAAQYRGHDNIFYTVPGKASKKAALKAQAFTMQIPRDHMPGLAWYHAHHHGSTTLQVPTSNGLIIVEDRPEFLPDKNGCKEARGLLANAPETVLHFALLPFMKPTKNTGIPGLNMRRYVEVDDANMQLASKMAQPNNPLWTGVKGTFSNKDFVLVNGGWQPDIPMRSGVYCRWRMAWATVKRFATIGIYDAATGKPATNCETLLLAKDGVFLMQMPRLVDHIFLAPGNRAELLVKCSGAVGKKYGPATPQAQPQLRACTPARAGYTADLQDASLRAAGAAGKLTNPPINFIMQPFGCLVNGKNFTFPDSEPIKLQLGKVVEWKANYVAVHPLHMHTNPFQIQDLAAANLLPGCSYTSWFEAGDYHDTLMLPQMQLWGTVRLRLQPGEFTGYAVMHCHSLQHEDVGCMKVLRYSCPGRADPQPRVCPGFKFPVPGTVVLPSQARRSAARASAAELLVAVQEAGAAGGGGAGSATLATHAAAADT
ncbi:HAD-superfamily subfamily IIA hydrolase [Micractinium conductrix]|uniref:HAD-superfamily subfamily IIA hydrolase n=1 Tax=Micractinium conductrix TaxID=554055 RepID=A0A2P6UZI8_9CHLO|nr:HAD-superfamily subfamily IIA hydrolase [Micractinium conductrix]|eukprot:PSC67257.1 HAD-superfamily subfamily IIA hydrolase [Micractinium conductrix]